MKAYSVDGKNYQQIMEEESISKSTVFRDIDLAIEELSVMLYGADIFYDLRYDESDGNKLGTQRENDVL